MTEHHVRDDLGYWHCWAHDHEGAGSFAAVRSCRHRPSIWDVADKGRTW